MREAEREADLPSAARGHVEKENRDEAPISARREKGEKADVEEAAEKATFAAAA